MKHNCKYYDEDGLNYFTEAIVRGVIKYDDFYDNYLIFYYRRKKFLFWHYGTCMADILMHCPFCGEKIYTGK